MRLPFLATQHTGWYNDRIGENEVKVMQTWTVVGNKAYDLVYTSLPTKYKEYLPIIEEIIDSFEIVSPADRSNRNQSQ
jgi:hypothetical protein